MKAVVRVGLILYFATFVAFGAVAYPGGGGGVEYYTNMDVSVLASIGIPTDILVDLPRGTVHGVGGFGYGIDRRGWKVGGFGKSILMSGQSLPLALPSTRMVVNSVAGGIGGLISGGHGRLGPIDLSVNVRLGVGGLAVNGYEQGYAPYPTTIGIVALYGSVDAEIGIVFFPTMMISAFVGVEGLAPVVYGSGLVGVPVPTMGVRLTWGRF